MSSIFKNKLYSKTEPMTRKVKSSKNEKILQEAITVDFEEY